MEINSEENPRIGENAETDGAEKASGGFSRTLKTGRAAEKAERNPVLGWSAVGLGLLAIFGPAPIFVPLGVVVSLIAVFAGQAMWGFGGLVLAAAGFLSSPILMGIVGIGWVWFSFDWSDILAPILQYFDGGQDV